MTSRTAQASAFQALSRARGLVVAGVLALVIAQPLQAQGVANNVDTGIRATQCQTSGTDVLVDCALADIAGQDGQNGRDSYKPTNSNADGALGLSFRKVCNSGEDAGVGTCPADPVLGPGSDDWGCVTDQVTGIMWEVKTTSGFRSRDLRYTNYSASYDPVGQFRSGTDATGFIDKVNKNKLCSFNDWGLAHTAKVQTIIDYGVANAPGVRTSTGFFPTIYADWYWNASPNPSSPSTAFALNFKDGSVSNEADRSTLRYAQAIRNSKDTFGPNGRYEYSADGSEVTDTSTNAQLVWRRCVEGMTWNGTACTGTALTLTHEQALQRAAQAKRLTGKPWRVPSVKEQNWLVQREIASPPVILHKAFPNTPVAATWTASPETKRPGYAWSIDLGVGLIVAHPRTDLLNVRLTRDFVAP